MDLSKLNSNERLAFWGAVITIIGSILTIVGGYGFAAGGLWLTVLLAIAMIVILFLPTWSPGTALPGSKGSLMLVVGGIAGIGALLTLLTLFSWIGFLGSDFLFVIGLLLGVIGGLLMGWGAWQEFQSEGGKFQLGGAAPSATTAPPAAAMADTAPPPAAAPPAAAPPPAPTSDVAPSADDVRTADADDPYGREDRPNP
jgi:hypothetical protein